MEFIKFDLGNSGEMAAGTPISPSNPICRAFPDKCKPVKPTNQVKTFKLAR